MCHGELVITLFSQVADNNSLKPLLQQFLLDFGAIFCPCPHERV